MVEKLRNVDVDITPTAVGGPTLDERDVIFQEAEKEMILQNPGGLTKEGCEECIRMWSNSRNKQVLAKYKAMKYNCKNWQKSGKTKDGFVIYARDKEGNPKWIESEKVIV